MNEQKPMRRQAGLSLVELMIAMLLGLILIGGVIKIYLSSKSSYRLEQGVAQVQEEGRFAIHFISNKVRMAGYAGCNSELPAAQISNILKLSGSAKNNYVYNFQKGVKGFDDITATPAVLGNPSHAPVKGSDILSVQTADGDGITLTDEMPSVSNNLKVSSVAGLKKGDIVMLSDCTSAAIFEITKIKPNAKANVMHKQDEGPAPQNKTKNLPKQFGAGSGFIKLATYTYFIAPRDPSDTNCSNGTCGLWVKVGNGPEQELVRGIEAMQVKYGISNGIDPKPEQYVSASSVTDWHDVVSIRVALLASSDGSAVSTRPRSTPSFDMLGKTVSAPETDMKLRRVFVRTIAIRNRMLGESS
jgi:type IV pilus assembly protein PilW